MQDVMNRKAEGGLKSTTLSMSSRFTQSEASPLLPADDPLDQVEPPPISPLVQALETTNFVHLQWQDLAPQNSVGMEPCKGLALALIVLLQVRKRQIAWKGQYPGDVYGQWTEEEARARNVEILEEKMSELWESFLTQHRGPLDLHDVLWTPFLLKQGRSRTIRGADVFNLRLIHSHRSVCLTVVDCLADDDAPSKFVAHPIVSMTMSRLWRYGRPDGNDLPTMFRDVLSTRAAPWWVSLESFLLMLTVTYIVKAMYWI